MTKDLNKWTRKELLSLPKRERYTKSVYDSILLLSTRKRHYSGWAMMFVIGVNKGEPVEIVSSSSDDIGWCLYSNADSGYKATILIHVDCPLKSGAIHVWSWHGRFRVGNAFSSITIELIPETT